MLFKPYPGTGAPIDLLQVIAPVFRLDEIGGQAHLIGTGFWVTEFGHLITARHVIDENIHAGADRGYIFAIQTFADRSVAVRNFAKSDLHPLFDLALSETTVQTGHPDRPTNPVTMSIEEPQVGDEVFSFAILSEEQQFNDEAIPGITTAYFAGSIAALELSLVTDIRFAVRLSFGSITEIFREKRDQVIYPYPCLQSNVPIYGGNSGGPLFDVRGRVRAISASSYEGTDISFHIPVYCALALEARTCSLGITEAGTDRRNISELAIRQKVRFLPPLLDAERPLFGVGVWLKYALKCLARLERPSFQLDFFVTKPRMECGGAGMAEQHNAPPNDVKLG